MYQLVIPLSGLNCMGCARKVEKALHANHDVEILNLSPTQVEVKTESSLKELVSSIESLGYQAGNHYELNLSGLSCGGCVKKLSSLLESNQDVISFEASTTHLEIRTLLSEQQVIDLIATLGYTANLDSVEVENESSPETEQVEKQSNIKDTQVPPASIQLQMLIQGMTCASCVSSVEKALTNVEGVEKAQVNLAEQSALVFASQDSDDLLNAIVESVKQAGYQAEILQDAATQQEKQAQQQRQQQKRFKLDAIAGLVVGAPLMIWGVAGGNMMIRNTNDQLAWGAIGIVCLLLLATAGKHFFSNAWLAATHKRATMDTLVALGTGAAWFYSMLVVIFPDWFPLASRHVYFEASAMIIGLISLGHYIEAKAKANTTRSLQALINLQPQQATVITEQGDQQIAVEQITLGMKLRIKPGEKVPVDGVVIQGESYIDESMLTGEPVPVLKAQEAQVSAGTLNTDGGLVIEATGIGANTMLARIIRMVRTAQSSKPAIAKLADQISSVFVPVVVGIAILAALVWFAVGPEPKASYMLVVTTTVLIIACPCALGLATPLSVTVGVGKAAELGILIKDADALQLASKVDTVVFDKTGTLTQGKPSVQQVFTHATSQEDLLALAYAAERQSEHPLAKAVCDYAKRHDAKDVSLDKFENVRGRGILATYQDKPLLIGSLQFMQAENVETSALKSAIDECAKNAWTPVAVALNGELIGLIAIADPIKSDAKQALSALKSQGIKTVMLTGDSQHVANAIGQELGIDEVIAQVMPDEKAQHIEQLQSQGHVVAMVGDGINDAPALALSNLGIAMGSGSDVAIESSQMTILNTSPMAVVHAIELSRATLKNMKQNLFGAFVYNSLGIPVAAGVLYPAFGFLLSPVVAGAAMALSSITVVSNANRLRLFSVK
ncbi:heavy metal translocating P-type ATPase [Vibrio alginolyticus]|uniref:heavy metal translocating P-type ATPase n=1 Tax=Vibrio alginolyticus TaxID=663 RepID=UPI0001BDEFD3|nr:copper-translocating P-type ATPase [Vibrio alginolyticus]EEZ84150.1 cation transport ATPase, E1-E2 family [Vibrio alginolyticus 40B]MBS9995279.1 heavy metal translocating P-type ATPase [Vibrio alginolyticus]MBT0080986.1 heavy metal translocating P-type ATPase [Vibrio alginolyticus]MBT0105618.1 heavy metal translocating P-type ATPase [Vibrio alginolyticus]HBK5919784.1 heavy metal translocating P-type ATPase [Vibrio alginolyticus]